MKSIAKTKSTFIHGAIVCASLAFFGLSGANAQQPDSATSPAATTVCTPVNAGVFDTRIHVRCSTAVSGIIYFAAPTSNNNRAARLLAILTTAVASSHNLVIYYDPADTSGTSIGCNASDCRLIQSVELL
ncbi:MAG TPA: hypothetical protein VFN25_10800 [Dokdonella sp.]|uniref:hypothetical protein n=1 Tax=Dokdonella sp. TaxID=2291710 RepID=UPI002D7FB159|nr:hypothetical protein [Dokdonella sp.]HET9033381.1 hypothetical protein [Dokdonella sp.]